MTKKNVNYQFKRISIRLPEKDYWILKERLTNNNYRLTLHDAILLGLNYILDLNLKVNKKD